MKKLTFNSIECKSSTNLPGEDDVFLMVQVDGGPPIRYPVDGTIQMDDGDTVDFPAGGEAEKPTFYYEHSLSVTVWDHDGAANIVNEADFLGSTALLNSDVSNTYSIHGVDSSHYHLDVIIETMNPTVSMSGQNLPSNLQSAAADAVLSWAQTKEGKAALKEDDPEELCDLMSQGLVSGAFDLVIDIIRSIPVIKAVSLGLMGQVEIFVGIDGACGVAMDIDDFPNSWSVFAGGGVVEGVDAGIQGTLALGFWFQNASEIGGFYAGAEVDIDDGLGVTAAAWASKSDKSNFKSEEGINLKYAKVIFIGIDVGIDDGVEAEELYCFAGHIEDYPSFQCGSYQNLALISDIICDDQHADDGFQDKVHFYWTADNHSQKYRFPIWNVMEMDQSSENDLIPGAVIKFDDKFSVDIHVEDNLGDKKTFKHTFELDDFSGEGSIKIKKYQDGGTEYHLSATLLVQG